MSTPFIGRRTFSILTRLLMERSHGAYKHEIITGQKINRFCHLLNRAPGIEQL